MHSSSPDDDPNTPPTPPTFTPGDMQDAHDRTGRMLKSAGLPFEADEFDDEDSSSSSSDDESSSSSDDAAPAAPTE